MKKALILAGSVLLFAACTEKGFDVAPPVEGDDTTYVATPESQQPRVVMLEEFTGVTCPNCPNGHALVATMQMQNPDRVLAVSYYANGIPQANPVHNRTKEDFRTTDATDIASFIFGGVAGLPSAGIDRVSNSNGILQFQNTWAGAVANRLDVPTPVNLKVTSEWDAATRTAVIHVRVAYTSAVSERQAVTLLLTENDLVDAQESVDTNSITLVLENYKFKHVLRDIITPVTGEVMRKVDAAKEPGRVYQRRFIYKVSDKWKAENCTLIALVHNVDGENKEVLQAAEAKLVE